jgi:hypothetical protein
LGEFSPIGPLGDCLLWAVFREFHKHSEFYITFSTVKVMYQLERKAGLATFWAAFSQIRLVTLAEQESGRWF